MSVSVIIEALMPAPEPLHRAVPPGIPTMRTAPEAWTDGGILDAGPRAGTTCEASAGPCVSPRVSRHA